MNAHKLMSIRYNSPQSYGKKSSEQDTGMNNNTQNHIRI